MATTQPTQKYVYNTQTDSAGNKSTFRVSLDQMEALQKTNPDLAHKLAYNMSPGQNPVSKKDLSVLINSRQATDAAPAAAADAVPTRTSPTTVTGTTGSAAIGVAVAGTTPGDTTEDTGYTSIYKDIIDSITGGTKAPETPNYTDAYTNMRKSYNLDSLEGQMNDLKSEQENLTAAMRNAQQQNIDSIAPMSTISGRVSETERAFMERLDLNRRMQSTLSQQISTANSTIENIMNLKKMDYEAAKDAYHTKITEGLSTMNTVRGIMEDQKTDAEKAQDNARANLQIIYGNIADSGKDASTLDPATKATVQKLELQAGLPSGFYGNIAKTDPGGKILSTTTRETGGAKYADILLRNADGSITTKKVYLGATDTGGGGSSKLSESEYAQAARSEMAGLLNSKIGSDGKVSPQDYLTARRAWVNKGLTADDFDKAFSNEFAKGAQSPVSEYQINEKADPLAALLSQ